MKTESIISLLMLAASLSAQTGKEWNDPLITSVNRCPAHTLALPMASETDLRSGNALSTPYVQPLDGTWKFYWASNPSKASDALCAATFDDSRWSDIDVPSSWQVYGLRHGKSWDKPLYCNVAYPFSFDKSTYSVMAERPGWFTYRGDMTNPVGTYRRTFTIPAEWDGRQVYVRFNGVGHGYYLWINGQRVGYSEDSYLPSEFDITPFLTEGENTIALQVYRFTSGSFLECQDYWRLTGIQRHCFLWAAPKTQLRDYFFTTDLDDTFTDARANVKLELDHADLLDQGSRVEVKIMDGASTLAQATAEAREQLSIDLDVKSPRLWSAETPNLYDLVITLTDPAGRTIDMRGGKVGFREVGVRADGALLINGRRMVFHGVNRHDFSPLNGRAITDAEIEEDLLTMKRLNINAVRTSHYPNDPVFYDLCDRLGLYVLAEANVECHAYQELSSESKFRHAMVERSENHVKCLRNHPSIFIWSFGNESGRGSNFQHVAQAIKALDTTRLTHYEGNSDYADVSSTMYGSYETIENIGRERLGKTGQRPHIQCENSHSMGNSMGNVRDMFNLYEKYPALTGEFIWDFKDQGLLTQAGGKDYWAYGGDFGDNPNDGNFCINGLVRPDWSLTSKSYNTKKVYQPLEFKAVKNRPGQFMVKNKLAFLPSSTYDVTYQLLDEDGTLLASGPVELDVPAADSATVTIDLAAAQSLPADREAFIRFAAAQRTDAPWAKAGYVVAEEKLQVKTAEKPLLNLAAAHGTIAAEETSSTLTLTGADFSLTFNKTLGYLSAYTCQGTPLISRPLKLNAFRLPTDNDGRQSGSWDTMGLRALSSTGRSTSLSLSTDASTATVTQLTRYTGQNGTFFDVQTDFLVLADGTLLVNALITPSSTGAILPKLGFRLEMPADMEQLSWFGRGPWDSYRDRKEACLPAIYRSTVTDQREDYILPQEHGTKQEVRWMALTNEQGQGLLFVAPDQMAASALHFRPEDNYTDRSNRSKHTYQFKTCTPTVVCLDAATRGLGNASCGPDVMDKYELKAAVTPFRFIVRPLTASTDPAQAARISMPVCQPVSCQRNAAGRISMTTATTGATIYYSIDEGEWQRYTSAFTHNEACNIRTQCKADGLVDSPVSSFDFDLFINKTAWRLVSADSQHAGNEASKAFDNDLSTFWHTEYWGSEPACPHTLVVDMRRIYQVTAVTYNARTDGSQNGMIRAYEVYLSLDGKTWDKPVLSGEFKNTTAQQVARLTRATPGRYLKLVAKSEINNNAWTSAAEIGIQAEADITGIGQNPQATPAGQSATYYTLQGTPAKTPTHGVYVQKGKKVLF